MFSYVSDAVYNVTNWARKEEIKEPEAELDTVSDPFRKSIEENMQEIYFESRDGINIKMLVLKGGPKCMLLCSPLGFEDISIFYPLIHHFGSEYTYVNWNYRGLFDSDMPKRNRKISIRDHAEDAAQVIIAAGFESATVVGYSMGVQVSLELCLIEPQLVDSMVLINGAHGGIFSTAFQPLIKLPFIGNISEWLIDEMLKRNPQKVMDFVVRVLTSSPIEKALHKVGKYGGSKMLHDISGEGFINDWIKMYFGGLAKAQINSTNYCRLFQELNAHSVKHLLNEIHHPTLLIAGRFDYLTPYYHMIAMHERMPNSKLIIDNWSTHLSLLENPDLCVNSADEFLSENQKTKSFVSKHIRRSSTCFEMEQATGENSAAAIKL